MSEIAESQPVPVDEQALTERQRSVLERIDRRVPIKLIAQELGVSETRINQHIRILKDIYQVTSLNELVEVYRQSKPAGDDDLHGLNEFAPMNGPLPATDVDRNNAPQLNPGNTGTSNVFPMGGPLPPESANRPKITPGMLNGENAALFRIAAIVGIAMGIAATVVLMITVATSLSEAMDGVAHIPVDRNDPG